MCAKKKQSKDPVILLIDGQCNMCHGISKFVIRRDPSAKFRFASLQSETGQRLLQDGGLSRTRLDTFIMIDNGRYDIKSTAALRTFRKLGGAWALLYTGIIVPRAIRDRVYEFIAKRRYRWFGYNESCLIPTEDVRKRFIDD
ncbi:thiol-disulfide oxidoreductase DCC family protein [Cohnella mopanensis]|uniref:thiol-disulfide oxidoreductase DCC family protein n=1 Tax=Cohnella mopanensis TaxID=2911966 RepID=UPI001EF9082D|nr:DCC1-like thiol-disulfide oxidoreductase family protein [Cohnella mopanensis]